MIFAYISFYSFSVQIMKQDFDIFLREGEKLP